MIKIEIYTAEMLMKLAGGRPYCWFLFSTILKSAATFMNVKHKKSEIAQINTLY